MSETKLTPAQLEQRANANLRHGARSEVQIRPVARNQKRRLLRQIGLRASDLDGLALGYLDAWARCAAKVELLDKWIDEHGLVDDEGNPPPFMALYVSLVNSARLSLQRLEGHLSARVDVEPLAVLEGTGRRIRLEAEERLSLPAGDGR